MKPSIGKHSGNGTPQIVPDAPTDTPRLFNWRHYLVVIPIILVMGTVGYYTGKYYTITLLTKGQLGIACQK